MTLSVAERAGSLEAVTWAYGAVLAGVPAPEVFTRYWRPLSVGAWDALERDITQDELDLAGTCLTLEVEIKERQWRALELLLSYSSPAGVRLPNDSAELAAVAGATFELGWEGVPSARFGTRWHPLRRILGVLRARIGRPRH